MLGGFSYRDMNEAMLADPQKSWSGPLITLLDAEIKPPKTAKDHDAVDNYRDQLFWQTTSAEVLGQLKDSSAVQPLMKVMLDPAKGDVQATGVLALVKIGQPAVDTAVKLLQDKDDKLAAFALRRIKEVSGAKKVAKNKPYIQTAALILGTIGRASALQPMIDALGSTKNETNKAVIAREITKIPATPESKKAFEHAYESISIDTVLPPRGNSALQALTEAASSFYDPGMVDWLLDRAENTKGGAEDKKALQGTITVTVLKLVKPDQLGKAKAAVDKYGTKIEKDAYAHTDKILKACGERVSCYLAAIEKSENQEQKSQFAGIKAGYMIGILGNEQTVDELVKRLGSIDNAAVRFTASQAIDHLLPKGSTKVADELDKIIDKNLKSADRDKIMGDAPLKQVMYRIRTRAQ